MERPAEQARKNKYNNKYIQYKYNDFKTHKFNKPTLDNSAKLMRVCSGAFE